MTNTTTTAKYSGWITVRYRDQSPRVTGYVSKNVIGFGK